MIAGARGESPAGGAAATGTPILSWLRLPAGTKAALAEAYWFLVLVSWLPIIAGFSTFIDYFSPLRPAGSPALPVLAGSQPFVMLAVAAVIAVLALVQRRPILLLAVPAPLIAGVMLDPAAIRMAQVEAIIVYLLYLQAFLVSLGLFCILWRVRTAAVFSFGFFIFVELVLTTVVAEFFPTTAGHLAGAIVGLAVRTYSLSFLDVALFAAVVVACRFTVLVVVDNRGFVARFVGAGGPRLALKAATKWWPMLFIYLGFGFFYAITGDYLERVSVDTLLPEVPAEERATMSLETALNTVTTRSGDAVSQEARTNVNAASIAAQNTADRSVNEISPQIHAAFPSRLPGTQTGGCSWYDVICLVMDGIKSMTNSAYVSVKGRVLAGLDAQLISLRDGAKGNAEQLAADTALWLDARITEITNLTHDVIAKVFRGFRDLSLLFAIYTFMILIKSYLFVLSRELFRAEAGLSAGISDAGPAAGEGNIVLAADGEDYEITSRETFFVSSKYVVKNRSNQPSLPKPITSPIPRIISRTYVMKQIDYVQGKKPVLIKVDSPARIVAWNLVEGEEVVFQYGDLVAFSKNLTISTYITARIETVVFGRIVYRRARGPGVLVLRTLGDANVSPQRQAYAEAESSGLIAWGTKSRFHIASMDTLGATYLADHNIVPKPKATLIYDNSGKRIGTLRSGAARFIRYFLLPL